MMSGSQRKEGEGSQENHMQRKVLWRSQMTAFASLGLQPALQPVPCSAAFQPCHLITLFPSQEGVERQQGESYWAHFINDY